ncbi:uncharacterized protein LOC108632630 [Ceratina calcarata]|uniref:Uncharacterized protein LOC108632630 n=1 Tax=Ceratina calcarata TaxID=156304 RepID=A0AAJ7NFM3_9HYME|nr:uncharacterized protein LOC108632630 [Ceratina calcarata]
MIVYLIIVLFYTSCEGLNLNHTNVRTLPQYYHGENTYFNNLEVFVDSKEKATSSYPNTGVKGILGFAKAARVTGGTSGPVVFVSTIDELRNAVSGSDKKVVVINRNLLANTLTKVTFGSNKSIIGSYGNNILHNVHLRASQTSGNVIFQNIVFRHDERIKANDDIQLYLNYGTGYWVDHCYWPGHNWSDADGSADKLIYVGEKANYVTISHCYFKNHRYGCIFGHPADDNNMQYLGYPRITICHNRYDNVLVRAPGLMRYGYYHVYNNYIDNFRMSFIFLSHANIVSESNFLGKGSQDYRHLGDNADAKFTDHNSVPKLTPKLSRPADWTPNSNYNYKLMTAAEAKVWNTAHSGVANSANQLYFAE